MTTESWWTGYLKRVCWYLPIFVVILSFCIVAFLLSLITLFFVDVDPATELIVYANLVGLAGFIVGIGWLVRRCHQLDPR